VSFALAPVPFAPPVASFTRAGAPVLAARLLEGLAARVLRVVAERVFVFPVSGSPPAGNAGPAFVPRGFDAWLRAAFGLPLRAARVAPGIVSSSSWAGPSLSFCTAPSFCQRDGIHTSVAMRPHRLSRR
jgi:hypothetical protein